MKNIWKIILCILISLLAGFLFNIHPIVFFVLAGVFAYGIILVRFPEIALFLTILVVFDCFSMISENALRLPFLFRLRDVMLISMFFPFLAGVYKRDERIKNVFRSPIAKAILCISFIVLFQLLLTKIRFPQESVNSMVRMGRKYLYYCLFFPALYILQDKIKQRRFLKISISAIVIFAVLYIIQFFAGSSIVLFPYGRVSLQNLSGESVNRLYIAGAGLVTFLFQVLLMIILFGEQKRKKIMIFLLMLFGLQTVLTFGRAHILGVIVGTLFALVLSREKKLFKKVVLAVSFFTIITFFFSMGFAVVFPEKRNPVEVIGSRIVSTFDAVVNKTDTFGGRLEDSAGRIDLLKRHSIVGIGFLHDEADMWGYNKGTIARSFRTGDSGILSLLMDFGLFGFSVLLFLSFLFLKRAMTLYRRLDSVYSRALVLGIVSYYFGRLFSFITLADFVTYGGIVVITLSLVILELIAIKERDNAVIHNCCQL